MKNLIYKIKRHILLSSILFIIFIILLQFVLSLFHLRFRLWVIMIFLILSILGLGIGLLQKIHQKKTFLFLSVWFFVVIVFLISPLLYLGFILAIFHYKPEHTVTLEQKKYVAVVNSFLHVDVDYYDYYGPFLMGTKVKVHGYFGKGGFDPFTTKIQLNPAEHIYYDDKGKIKSKQEITFIKDQKGRIIDQQITNLNTSNIKIDPSEKYLLPENEPVLYEKKFNNTILRVGKLDHVLGQNMLVNVIRSKDNGKNFYVISDDVVQVSNEAKFTFLSEQLGFIISTGTISLDHHKTDVYVTQDGGKTFIRSIFHYENELVSEISIEKLPYYESNNLTILCSVYQINDSKDGYEEKELVFTSSDQGITWDLKTE